MIELREFSSADYDDVIALWRASEGVVLRDVDERPALNGIRLGWVERGDVLMMSHVAGDRPDA